MFRCLLWAIAAAVRPKVLLIADNVCLRQQLLVLQRRKLRPGLKDTDRCFWVLACRWFVDWRTSLLIVKSETVLRWQMACEPGQYRDYARADRRWCHNSCRGHERENVAAGRPSRSIRRSAAPSTRRSDAASRGASPLAPRRRRMLS